MMESIFQDLRFAVRTLLRNPGFTFVVVLTLTLGIGANSAIFSVVNSVLICPLAYPDPERLVVIKKAVRSPDSGGILLTTLVGTNELLAWTKDAQLPVAVAGYGSVRLNLTGRGEAEQVLCSAVTRTYLPVVGITPILGRNFLPDEDRAGGPPVVLVSDKLWQRKFGRDPQIVGQTVVLNQASYIVVGVLPPAAQRLGLADILSPALGQRILEAERTRIVYRAIGRIEPGASLEQARIALDGAYRAARSPNEQGQIVITRLQEHLVGHVRGSLFVLLGAAGCVLLIACSNAAGLLLTRAASRQKEMALRSALGGSPGRLVRQLLTESLLLAFVAGLAGLLLAYWVTQGLQPWSTGLGPVQLGRVDLRVLGVTLIVAILTGIFSGLAPALAIVRRSLFDTLKDTSPGLTAGSRQHRLRHGLVITEITLAVILLVGAGLLLKSYQSMRGIYAENRLDQLLSLTVDLSRSRYPDWRSQSAYFEEVIRRLQGIPGVEMVGLDATLPLILAGIGGDLEDHDIEGHVLLPGQPRSYELGIINPDYFRALGIPLHRGRYFTERDRAGAGVLIVNETFVRTFFPGEEPIGKRVRAGFRGDQWRTIVGVVQDIYPSPLNKPPPHIYECFLQTARSLMSLAIRVRGNPLKLAAAVRQGVTSMDKDQPVEAIQTMEQRLAGLMAGRRVMMLLLGTFSALAIGLAAVGIYSVIAHSVSERTHELGVRMALGASRRAVVLLVLKRSLTLALSGLILGLAGGAGLSRFIASQLYGVSALDPSTFAVAALVFIAVVLLASWLPARRAVTIDPLLALRHE